MSSFGTYQPRRYDLSGLKGISDRTLETHFQLYEGYVRETNRLNERLAALLRNGQLAPDQVTIHAELTRRLGFEHDGMVLHEYYFGNLKRGGVGDAPSRSPFHRAAEKSFGSYAVWKGDFVAIGAMRGVGWAICSQDPATGRLANHWVTLHESGHLAGYAPVLVMDVWEHAFLLDYKPSERGRYVEAFFANVDWNMVESRLAPEAARG